jgi:hypothetical protein
MLWNLEGSGPQVEGNIGALVMFSAVSFVMADETLLFKLSAVSSPAPGSHAWSRPSAGLGGAGGPASSSPCSPR